MNMDTDAEMTDVPVDIHPDAPGTGRPGLRPPPGFEHLLPAVARDNDSDSAAGSSYILSQDPSEIVDLGEPYVTVEAPSMSPSPPAMADRGEDEKPAQQTEDKKIRPLRITKIRLKTASMATGSERNGPGSSPGDQSGHHPSGQNTALSQAATQVNGSGPGPACGGMFPLPPPTNNETDTYSDTSSASGVDEKEDEKNDDKENEKPENIIRPSAPVPSHAQVLTYAQLSPHHRLQMLDIMKKKSNDIQEHEKLGNRNIMHLDWVAGNPKDPLKAEDPLGDPGDGSAVGLSDEDQILQMQLVELVTAFVNEEQGPPRDDEWSKAMFFGDWMQNSTGENMYFVEIQIKRISGADDGLLKRCGINPRYVWLSLVEDDDHDPNLPSPMRGYGGLTSAGNTLPPLVNFPGSGRGYVHLDASTENPGAQAKHLAVPPIGTFPSPTGRFTTLGDIVRGARERKTNNLEGAAKEAVKTPIDPRLEASGTAIKPDPAVMGSASGSTEMEKIDPRLTSPTNNAEATGIPHSLPSLPVKPSPSWGSTVTTCGDSEDELVATSAKFCPHKLPGVRELLAIQKAVGRRQEKNLEELLHEPGFASRKNKSFVYAVRVVAIPERCHVLNAFNGPDREERYATLLGSGGWVVPPVEERIKWHNDRKESRPVLQEMPDTNTTSAGKPQVCRAHPVCFDWTGSTSPRYYGESPPLWRELADPCLEDVYWMVWQLFAGRQFVGFRSGTGFGQKPLTTKGDANLVSMCELKSPSREALRSSAGF